MKEAVKLAICKSIFIKHSISIIISVQRFPLYILRALQKKHVLCSQFICGKNEVWEREQVDQGCLIS